MVEFEIHPRKTCLLIIDMTNAFLRRGAPTEIPGGRSLVRKLKTLVTACRGKGIRIIFATHAYRKDGYDLGLHAIFRPEIAAMGRLREGTSDTEFYSGLKPQRDDIVIVKRRFSAFLGTELDMILRSNGIDTVIIGGVATNICCESTARDARMRDYRVLFLGDGTAARGVPDKGWGEMSAEEVQTHVLATMASSFAEVSTVREIIARISRA